MSTPSWQRKGNTYCKYCQQWIRDTPSEKRNHERSKHHVFNVQKHINDQQTLERNKQKEEQRNRKILDNIERKVKSGSGDGENPYYQAFLKHQQEMENLPSVVMESVFNNLTNQIQQSKDIPHDEQPQHEYIEEQPQPESFECNELPLGEISKSQPIEVVKVTPKTTLAPKTKTYNEPTEIGGYYDDPNFFYYEQEEEEKKVDQTEQFEKEEIIIKKDKPSQDWKNQFDKFNTNTVATSASTFGQWEIVKVSKVETETAPENSETIPDTHFKTEVEHEEDQLGGSYYLSDSKKRKNIETNGETLKKVKTEDNAPRKPLSFSLSKKK